MVSGDCSTRNRQGVRNICIDSDDSRRSGLAALTALRPSSPCTLLDDDAIVETRESMWFETFVVRDVLRFGACGAK
jgi:hypothetical protein